MGGSLIADVLGNAAKSVSEGVIGKELGTSMAKEAPITRGLFQDKTIFNIHPQAAALHQLGESVYEPIRHKVETAAVQAAKAGRPLTDNFGNPIIEPSDIIRHAHDAAYKETYGKNGWRIQAALKAVERDKGANHAQVLADTLHIKFHQEQPTPSLDLKGKIHANLTPLQRDLAHNYKEKELEPFIARNSKYKEGGSWERKIATGQRVLAYKAAIIHAATAATNIAYSDGYWQLFKLGATMWGPGREGAVNNILNANNISNLWMDAYKEELAFKHGVISKYAPGSVGEFLHKNIMLPGLQSVRRESILWSALAGKRAAEVAAKKLQIGDTKWATEAFKELHIDPKKIASQGFQLGPEDIDKAYFHGADKRIMLSPYDATPSLWRQSPYLRQMKAFSGYVTKQGDFYRSVFMRQLRQGDYIGIARNLANISLVFPLVGASVYEIDRLLTGRDWDDPEKHMENRANALPIGHLYHEVEGDNDPQNWAKTSMNTVDMLSKLAAFGGVTGYLRGANRANLIEEMAPPWERVGSTFVQDAFKASTTDSRHKDAWKPVVRDTLDDLLAPLGVGEMTAHKLLPTKKESAIKKSHRLRHGKKGGGESMNPLSYNNEQY